MMEIPVNAKIECADGPCGKSTYVIMNPDTRQVTHLVLKQRKAPHTERLVPMDLVGETTSNSMGLCCTRDDLRALDRFGETEFIRTRAMHYVVGFNPIFPVAVPEQTIIRAKHHRIPPGELAVRRGARVEARDGRVGRLDEFLVDPTDGHINYLVLRRGHLWDQKDVFIPPSAIDHFEEDTVYLNIDKTSVKSLPAISVRRRIG